MRLTRITRRCDLLTGACLGATRADILDVLDYVARILAINESAGEKAIPAEIKRLYAALPLDERRERELFAKVDEVIIEHYGFTPNELDSLVNYEIRYRMGDMLGDGEEG
jgi:hypothetical protein